MKILCISKKDGTTYILEGGYLIIMENFDIKKEQKWDNIFLKKTN